MFDNAQKERDILHSEKVKAGKRIYYIDVKQSRNTEMYLCITESKKVSHGDDAAVNYEKHKVFLYREDFDKFKQALTEAIDYIEQAQGKVEPRPEHEGFDLKIDMDFEA